MLINQWRFSRSLRNTPEPEEHLDEQPIPPSGTTVGVEDYKKLQLEAKNHRIGKATAKAEAEGLKTELAAAKARAAELEAANAKRDQDELVQKEEYKKLWEKSEADKQQALMTIQTRAVDASLEAAASQQGIDPKTLSRLKIDRTGISIDTQGNITGIPEAIERFKTQNADILSALELQKKAAAAPTAPTVPTGKPGAIDMVHPATGVSYKDLQGSFGGGANPPAAGQGAPDKPDFSKMTTAEVEAWYKTYRAKLPR